jgi:hypothetical protein
MYYVELDPAFHFDADPDPAIFMRIQILVEVMQVYKTGLKKVHGSRVSLHGSSVSLHGSSVSLHGSTPWLHCGPSRLRAESSTAVLQIGPQHIES